MSNTFRALLVRSEPAAGAAVENLSLDHFAPGPVTVRLHFSALNFKDALAVTHRGKILRQFPLVAGIDGAGVVTASQDPSFRAGDPVIVHGGGVGETRHGGFAEFTRVGAEQLVRLPPGLSLREAVVLGTAGFTAALALDRMNKIGLEPAQGPVAVTGATGGVGGFALQIFARAGFEITAVTGKSHLEDHLMHLGASRVVAAADLGLGTRALERGLFGGVVDNVGGDLLARLLAHVHPWGAVAAIGLAASADLHTTVMPFILRGVSLLGISSSSAPPRVRADIWQKLAGLWKPRVIEDLVTRVVGLGDVVAVAEDMLARRTYGRVLVDLGVAS